MFRVIVKLNIFKSLTKIQHPPSSGMELTRDLNYHFTNRTEYSTDLMNFYSGLMVLAELSKNMQLENNVERRTRL